MGKVARSSVAANIIFTACGSKRTFSHVKKPQAMKGESEGNFELDEAFRISFRISVAELAAAAAPFPGRAGHKALETGW